MNSIGNSQVGQNVKNITPTVIVGLGGTGWEVIKRVQERLNYYIGGLHHYACLNFLHIDTDKPRKGGWKDTAQTKHVHAHRGAEGLFDSVDTYKVRSWFQARGDEPIKVFDTGAGQVRPYGRLAFFSNYSNNGIEDAIKTAFNNIKDKSAREKLKNSPKYKYLEETTTINIDDEGNNNVIIIASIAGGTGSGMFFDAVAALRHQMNGKGMVYAYLLFPDHYRDVSNLESMRANGYAFLEELDYFQSNSSKNRLEVHWPGCNAENIAIEAILVDRAYLFSHTDELGRVTQKEDIFDSIAESIFKDFTFGGFADEKRSAENNDNTDLHTVYVQNAIKDCYGNMHYRKNSRNFQSQGYSSLGMPHDELIEACAYRLAAEVINSWQPENSSNSATSASVDEALKKMGLRFSLAGVSSGGGSQGKEDLNTTESRNWCRMLKRRRFTSRDDDGDINALIVSLLKKRDDASLSEISWLDVDLYHRLSEVNDLSSQSSVAKLKSAVDDCNASLESRCNAYLSGLSNSLDKQIQERIKSWCAEQIENQVSFLDIRSILSDISHRLNESAQRMRVSLSTGIDNCRKAQWNIFVSFINKLGKYPENDKIGVFRRLESWFGAYEPCSERRALIDQVVKTSFGQGDNIGFLEYSLYKCVLETCAKLIERVATYSKHMAEDYCIDNIGLSNAYAYLNECAVKARNVHSSQHVKSLYSGDLVEFNDIYDKSLDRYRLEHSDIYHRDNVDDEVTVHTKFVSTIYREISSEFIERLGGLGDLKLALARGFDEGQVVNGDWINTLLAITQTYFRDSLPKICCFWDRFIEAFNTPAKQREALDELYQNSAYWLNCDHSFVRNTLSTGGVEQDTLVLIGLPALPLLGESDNSISKLAELRQKVCLILDGMASGSNVTFKDLPTCDELIIYRRSVALPLCYSNELPAMQEAYQKIRATGKPLHITWRNRIFSDISLLTEATASAMVRTVRTATLGLAFNVIKLTPRPMSPGDSRPIYDYTYIKSGLGEDVNFLGQSCDGDSIREVSDHLIVHNKSDIVADIERKIDKRLEALKKVDDNGETLKRWAIYCQLLLEDVPREKDRTGKLGPCPGRETEYYVYQALIKDVVSELSKFSWWVEEDRTSECELVELAKSSGNDMFPPRSEDKFRLWKEL